MCYDYLMNENIPNLQELQKLREQEEAELLAGYLIYHPDPKPLPRDLVEKTRAEFNSLVAEFELRFSLEGLHSIIDLTPEEAKNHPLWGPANTALAKIVEILNKLKATYGETSLEYQSVKEKYMRLSRAVGILHNNTVDHTRLL